MITNPILQEAYEAGWYYPYTPSQEVLDLPAYQRAVAEGWHEWIESDQDVEAIKRGYVFDLSRDVDGKPCYFFHGEWVLHDGTVVPVEQEAEHIGYVGKADHMLRFAEVFLRHTKAPLAGKPYRFIPWMRKLCATLFGWVHGPNADGHSRYRRYQHAYVALAKKNGKSALMSVIALYLLVADGTPKAQVYTAACDRNQARIIYDEASHMVKDSPVLADIITIVDSRGRLVHQPSGSFYCVLSADAHRNEGIDASGVLLDELHVHPNRKLYTVLKRAGQARPNPLTCVITTYGPSLGDGSIWAEVHKHAKQQLDGQITASIHNYVMIASAEPISVSLLKPASVGDTKLYVSRLTQPVDASTIEFDLSDFAAVEQTFGNSTVESKVPVEIVTPARRFQDYLEIAPLTRDLPAFSEAVANLDWRSDHAIIRANPSVGVTFKLERLRKEIEDAKSPEAEAETRQLNLNIVSGSGRKWLSTAAWQACGKIAIDTKVLRRQRCYGGFDISFANDLTAFALAFPRWDAGVNFADVTTPRIDLLVWAWVPKEGLEDREESEQFSYRHYAAGEYFSGAGCIRLCEGRVIDYGQVCREVHEILQFFQPAAIAYDPNYASFVVPSLESQGYALVAHRQGAVSMSPPCKRFSELVYRGWLAHGNNPILDRAVEGAQTHPPDKAGNTYLAKGKSTSRIDALVASVMAVGFACDPPTSNSGAWADSSCGMWG